VVKRSDDKDKCCSICGYVGDKCPIHSTKHMATKVEVFGQTTDMSVLSCRESPPPAPSSALRMLP
jgi:hypothetical protein